MLLGFTKVDPWGIYMYELKLNLINIPMRSINQTLSPVTVGFKEKTTANKMS